METDCTDLCSNFFFTSCTFENKFIISCNKFYLFFSTYFSRYVKFDDNKRDHRDNNQTGTQDPPGPAGPGGPQGVQGPIGPQGLNQINSTNVYTVFSNFSSTEGVLDSLSLLLCVILEIQFWVEVT